MGKDSVPGYWEDYNNLQRVKHALVKRYLDGWFAKLGFWAGRVVYCDTHAGRGRHAGGEHGSPLVALKSLLNHSHRDQLLARCEFVFKFMEWDESNVALLHKELDALGGLPANVRVGIHHTDSFETLRDLADGLKTSGQQLAPALFFIDPYGFKVPGRLLKDLMSFSRVELFVNVIWRELDMAAQGEMKRAEPTGMTAALDSIFAGRDWRSAFTHPDHEVRAARCAGLFRELTRAKWATYMRMGGQTGTLRYLLLHLTQHDAGRDLMKHCMWQESPEGGFYAGQLDNPKQQVLISMEPDLRPVEKWLIHQLRTAPERWQALVEKIRPTDWLTSHVWRVVREMRIEGTKRKKARPWLIASNYRGTFSQKANPLLTLGQGEDE